MARRTLTIEGPFTDQEIKLIWQLLQLIEAKRPDERFKLVIDDPESKMSVAETMQKMDEIAEVAEGYARVKGVIKDTKH